MKRLEALTTIYDRLSDRIVVTIMGGFPTATSTASDLAGIAAVAGVPRTASVSTLDDFARAFDDALGAGDLTTIVAKVEAVGPPGFVTDLSLLENRFQFARSLRS